MPMSTAQIDISQDALRGRMFDMWRRVDIGPVETYPLQSDPVAGLSEPVPPYDVARCRSFHMMSAHVISLFETSAELSFQTDIRVMRITMTVPVCITNSVAPIRICDNGAGPTLGSPNTVRWVGNSLAQKRSHLGDLSRS